ncbi:MAG: glutamine-hydrolyzing carbamoyl-phosphate synthase small subunit [Bacteroidota bacterium]
MRYVAKKPAVLLLEDGTAFYGKAAGAIGMATGEICFNTGMTGYQEIFTDPSYAGQLMVMASVHIGNYGIIDDESESSGIKISGLICRNLSATFSRVGNSISLQEFLDRQKIVVVTDIDTRAIVKHIRSKGAMNALISTGEQDIEILKRELKKVPSMEGLELSSQVSTSQSYFFGESTNKYRVAVLDEGVKINTLRNLANRNCYVRVFPYNATFDEIQSWSPDGILVSNGPGDPSALPDVVKTLKRIVEAEIPLMGICLGHQLLALACGISTYKMHHGHRGINHPVKNQITGKSEITSQNHGFAVNKEEIENASHLEITHVNLNDQSIEGIRVKGKPAFSVQYHPEAAPGPHDAAYLFDEFLAHIITRVNNPVAAAVK